MKPLPSAPLTDADYEIWYNIDVRSSARYPPCLRAHWADRRDADLMLCDTLARTDPVGASALRLQIHRPRPATEWDL
jgi:hypothetical protein